jgi:hypothetical protein
MAICIRNAAIFSFPSTIKPTYPNIIFDGWQKQIVIDLQNNGYLHGRTD